jgi:hypothetical protein
MPPGVVTGAFVEKVDSLNNSLRQLSQAHVGDIYKYASVHERLLLKIREPLVVALAPPRSTL